MSINKEDAQTRRQRLLAARAECLAKMTPRARRAFEQRQRNRAYGQAKAGPQECEVASDTLLAQEIKKLVAEAHRLRQNAENNRDYRAALRGLDTALRALQTYGKATGEITTARRIARPTAKVVPSRVEGIETATELLLALATREEISGIIPRLERRRLELTSVVMPAATAESNTEECRPEASPESSEWMEIASMFDSDEVDSGPGLE